MTQSCWTCCLSLRDSAKKKRFTASCRICEAGSRTRPALSTLRSVSLPLSTATSLRLRQILPHAPLLSLPQGEALESHCGNLHVSPSLLSSPGDWLPSECHQKKTKKPNTKYPRSTVFDKNHPRKSTEHLTLIILGTILRGMNSGLYFQTNMVLLFGEVLVLKPKKEKKSRNFLWYNTKVWKDFVLILLLCRQFLVVERTVILFSY